MTRYACSAVMLFAFCFFAIASEVVAQQPAPTQDDTDLRAYVLNEEKLLRIEASFADVVACRKQNRAAWDQMAADPSYSGATLTEKAKLLDTKVPQCAALVKKHNMDTHEYLVALEALNQATTVVTMKKRGLTIPAAKVAETISPETLAFVESHNEEIEKWRQAAAAQAK